MITNFVCLHTISSSKVSSCTSVSIFLLNFLGNVDYFSRYPDFLIPPTSTCIGLIREKIIEKMTSQNQNFIVILGVNSQPSTKIDVFLLHYIQKNEIISPTLWWFCFAKNRFHTESDYYMTDTILFLITCSVFSQVTKTLNTVDKNLPKKSNQINFIDMFGSVLSTGLPLVSLPSREWGP